MSIFNSNSHNMKNIDAYIRLALSFVMIIISVITQCYILMLISMVLAYTGIKRHCFIYELFKINKKFSLKNYYMSHLPKYNPSAVFMFNKNGELYFKNESAKKYFKHIEKFSDFDIKSISSIINTQLKDTIYYEYNGLNYQLDIQGVVDIESVLIYATDISEMMNLNEEIEKTQKEIIYTMGEIGETRSKETGNHVKRVAQYSELLALLHGLSEEEANKLKMASPMHDIGKVGIPDTILNKPGRHTAQEFGIMKTHAQLGFDMLKNSDRPIIKAAAIVAGQHHEKFNGTGYPNGLKGEEIHIYGRITALADVFDALGSKRIYKDAWELDKILELFKEEKGEHFDPKLIDLFFDNLDKFLVIRDKYSDG